MKITLTNVRGFEGTHEISIRPITILLGENSSGKTTLLGAISAALNPEFPATDNLFNRAPFELGSFDTIATYRGGKYGRATSFSMGWKTEDKGTLSSINATFKSHDGAPRLDNFTVYHGLDVLTGRMAGGEFNFEFTSQGKEKSRSLKAATNKQVVVKFKTDLKKMKSFRIEDTVRVFFDGLRLANSRNPLAKIESHHVIDSLHHLTMNAATSRPHATALAPLRTRPRRTYDELNEEFKPEGDHVPLVLARLLSDKQRDSSIELDALMRYGKDSGLFEKIDVKRLGKQPSDPFQVRIKMKGPDANLIDVGYGVSQSLPIVIDSIIAPKNEILLVQQPEVHLHPRAQAALGSFFVELAATTSKHFVVETHSDYLVDRIRISIAEGKIPAEQVQLLFLERKGLDVKVHELSLDDLGNITKAPPSYREFFFKEEMKLMSRAS
jgi:energy-coupling factor transporter ATP-binding protein EcfA2